LGFKAFHDRIPDIVGNCRVNVHYNPENGDGLQETTGANSTGGLLVWRKADNWTAFTDGARTWVNGPYGLQSRLNTERFRWEEGQGEVQETPRQIPRAWQDSRNYSYWGPYREVEDGNPRAAGQPSIYRAARVYDSYARQLGKRADLEQQVRGFANWYFSVATVSQIYLDTAGVCAGVAKAAASGDKEPSGREAEVLALLKGLLHLRDKKYMPGKDILIQKAAKDGTPLVLSTSNDSQGSWTRVILGVDLSRGIVWASDFGRPPIVISISNIEDNDIYIPVPPGQEKYYPADKVVPAVMSADYLRRITFDMDREVIDYISSLDQN